LGASIDIGSTMACKILKKNGQVIYSTYVRSLTPDEIHSSSERKEREEFDAAMGKKYGFPMNEADFRDDTDYADFATPTSYFYKDDEVHASKMPDIDTVKSKDDVDSYY
jgi:hypothetical protein